MIKEFVFTVGLPGCGKSTYLAKTYPRSYGFASCFSNVPSQCGGSRIINDDDFVSFCLYNKTMPIIVSADEIKPFIDGYDPNNPQPVHEESVARARNIVEKLCKSVNVFDTVIMDGGAINRTYTVNIIKYVRNVCPNCKIKAVYFDTPIEVCLKRIEGRDRKVPVSSIYDKNQKIVMCVNRYRELVDEFIRVDYYTNKYILLDMDGTICGYSKARFDEDGNADFVNGELFAHLRPVKSVIDYVKEHYDMENVFIVTAVANSIAWQEKQEWLDKYFPEIPKENRYFCGNKDYKYVFVKQLAEHKGWERNEMVLVDDYHYTIEKCKSVFINCLHPSNIEALSDPYSVFS